jgi:hypothetical protein
MSIVSCFLFFTIVHFVAAQSCYATSCSSCASQSTCGWCSGSQVCLTGTTFGPTGSSCSSGWIWTSGSCPGASTSAGWIYFIVLIGLACVAALVAVSICCLSRKCPGFRCCNRFRRREEEAPQRQELYEVKGPEVTVVSPSAPPAYAPQGPGMFVAAPSPGVGSPQSFVSYEPGPAVEYGQSPTQPQVVYQPPQYPPPVYFPNVQSQSVYPMPPQPPPVYSPSPLAPQGAMPDDFDTPHSESHTPFNQSHN